MDNAPLLLPAKTTPQKKPSFFSRYYLLISFFFLLLSLPLAVFLVGQKQEIRKEAGEPKSLATLLQPFNVGTKTFTQAAVQKEFDLLSNFHQKRGDLTDKTKIAQVARDSLTRQAVLEQEKDKLGVTVTAEEVEEEIAKRAEISQGKTNLLAKIAVYQWTEEDLRSQIYYQLLEKKMRQRVEGWAKIDVFTVWHYGKKENLGLAKQISESIAQNFLTVPLEKILEEERKRINLPPIEFSLQKSGGEYYLSSKGYHPDVFSFFSGMRIGQVEKKEGALFNLVGVKHEEVKGKGEDFDEWLNKKTTAYASIMGVPTEPPEPTATPAIEPCSPPNSCRYILDCPSDQQLGQKDCRLDDICCAPNPTVTPTPTPVSYRYACNRDNPNSPRCEQVIADYPGQPNECRNGHDSDCRGETPTPTPTLPAFCGNVGGGGAFCSDSPTAPPGTNQCDYKSETCCRNRNPSLPYYYFYAGNLEGYVKDNDVTGLGLSGTVAFNNCDPGGSTCGGSASTNTDPVSGHYLLTGLNCAHNCPEGGQRVTFTPTSATGSLKMLSSFAATTCTETVTIDNAGTVHKDIICTQETPTPTPTPPTGPSSTPTPTPTPTPVYTCDCKNLKVYRVENNNWIEVPKEQLSTLPYGTRIKIVVRGETNDPAGITKGKIRVLKNGQSDIDNIEKVETDCYVRTPDNVWAETTCRRPIVSPTPTLTPGVFEYYVTYTVPSDGGSFRLEGMVYNQKLGWK